MADQPGLDIDVVIVGRNQGHLLRDCLQSIEAAAYTRGEVRMYYVDRDSSDDSVAIAREFSNCTLIEMLCDPLHLSCARNAGWHAGGGSLVQFLDPAARLLPDWFQVATKELKKDVGAVVGQVEPLAPAESYLDWVTETERRTQLGDITGFGTYVLLRRAVLEETGGYDEGVKTEDALDLSSRVARSGHRILGLVTPMLQHLGEAVQFDSYVGGLFRQGRGLAAISARRPEGPHPQLRDTWRRGGGSLLLMLVGLIGAPHSLLWLFVLFGGIIVLLYPRIFGLGQIARKYDLSSHDAARFGWHASVAVLPKFMGVLTESIRRLFSRS